MAFWYEGNLNNEQNRHEHDGAVYFVRGVIEVDGVRYERYAVQTHFIERGEDLIEVLRRYLSPLVQPNDIVMLGEKVVSMCQNNTVDKKDIRVGFWARFLSRFATHNINGIGMDEPYKLQLAINMKGLPLILWACFCGGIARLFGKRGVFYKIVGQEVSGIDGFYGNSAFETYHNIAVLNPKNPNGVCKQIEDTLNIMCAIVDANDINVEVMGKSPSLIDMTDAFLSKLILDNPSGQDDELTPIVIVRDIKDAPAMHYVPPKPLDAPPDH